MPENNDRRTTPTSEHLGPRRVRASSPPAVPSSDISSRAAPMTPPRTSTFQRSYTAPRRRRAPFADSHASILLSLLSEERQHGVQKENFRGAGNAGPHTASS